MRSRQGYVNNIRGRREERAVIGLLREENRVEALKVNAESAASMLLQARFARLATE